ncbi:hypothetical protein C4579_02880 [Candidatus Microgenomates bacterium]|nr:MAG: hypothetical protein C4579_02880 [Candidatus Microgenomates bacterium]
MDITHLGHASFRLKGKKTAVITDPFDSAMVGIKFPKVTADIITVSHHHHDHDMVSAVAPASDKPPVVFDGPGEYESGGVEVVGIETFHDDKGGSERGKNTVYVIDVDGLYIVHCGDLGHKLTDAQVDMIERADVLMIPVGGHFTIDAKVAAEVVGQLEPSIVIPMHYGTTQLNQKNFSMLAPVSAFLKEMGVENVEPIAKLTVSRDKLPAEMQVVVLE